MTHPCSTWACPWKRPPADRPQPTRPVPRSPRALKPSELIEYFFPSRCVGCRCAVRRRALCRWCYEALPWLDAGQRVSSLATDPAAILALLSFEGDARGWIHRFKYPAPGLMGLDPGALGVVRLLAGRLAQAAEIRASDWIVPVPLHPRRFRERAFNPSAVLAREIARPGESPVRARWLCRVRETLSQAGLDAPSRRRNVAGAFACRPRPGPLPRRVWLVDDVTTTGATLAAAAAALRAEGVGEVRGLCLARTPPPGHEALGESRTL